MKLIRYWFTFDDLEDYDLLNLGCGVTAYTKEDAISIITKTVFLQKKLPNIASVAEDVDIRSLDQGHVIPNMESPVWRGVWFPRGFNET